MRLNTLLASIATLALGLSAGLADASTFVVYAPGLDATTAAATAQAEIGSGDIRVAGPIADWIGVADDIPVVVGATSVLRCEEEPRKRPLKGYLIGIENAMADMSYRDAIRDIDSVIGKLPCLAEMATVDDIYTLFFLQGVAKFFEADKPGAEAAFARAAAIAPGREWPDDWPPTPQPSYLEALRKVNASPPADLVVELDGTVLHNGVASDGSPRMLAGGHLLWFPATESGMFIEVPAREALPDQGVLVTTAGQLRTGLMAGESKFAPWLETVAVAEGWDDIVLVSTVGAVRYQNGEFTALGMTSKKLAAKARRQAKESKKLGTMPIVGLAVLGVGAAVTGGGLALNLSAYQSGIPKIGETLAPREEYEAKVLQNKLGMGLIIGGGATVAAGAIVTIIGLSIPDEPLAVTPWFVSDGETVAFGISGRLP